MIRKIICFLFRHDVAKVADPKTMETFIYCARCGKSFEIGSKQIRLHRLCSKYSADEGLARVFNVGYTQKGG